MSPEMMARIRLAGVLVLALLLQTTVVPDVRVLGVCPDLMLLCTVCAGLVGGPELGGLVGFSAGLLADLFLTTTPLGLSALAFSIIGYSVGALRRTVLQEGWLLPPATALVASSAGVILFVVAGVMVGQSQLTRMGPVFIVKSALLVGVMNAIVATPACRVMAWAASGSRRARVASGEVSSSAARHSSALGAARLGARGVGRHASRRAPALTRRASALTRRASALTRRASALTRRASALTRRASAPSRPAPGLGPAGASR